jgi:5'-3' exonuclease
MGVEALWTALEESKCVEIIGAAELTKRYRRLAIDLSIWIMEALTSPTLKKYQADPVVHIVYVRAVKLLKMGICPVFVVEGRERRDVTLVSTEDDATKKKLRTRQADAFWKACERCKEMLELLGVPVVQAKVEGEALCALLSAKGKVDGVITKDGDALLYGARAVISNFNVDNLDRSQLRCFEASKLRAIAAADDDEDSDGEIELVDGKANDEQSQILPNLKRYMPSHVDPKISIADKCVTLSRKDMICFALLTGSDLAGAGVENVGVKKALRFIKGCKRRSDRGEEKSAALRQMKDWANMQRVEYEGCPSRQCSVCLHPGNCRDHAKNGCAVCGTNAGESCRKALPDEKFRRNLRTKLQSVAQSASRHLLDNAISCYTNPNDLETPKDVRIHLLQPRIGEMIASGSKVNGRGKVVNHEFLQASMSKLLVRLDILCEKKLKKRSAHYVEYRPLRIVKECVHRGHKCYEVLWARVELEVGSEDDSIAETEFATVEWCSAIADRYDELCKSFAVERRKVEQQKNQDYRKRMFEGGTAGLAAGEDAGRARRRQRYRTFNEIDSICVRSKFAPKVQQTEEVTGDDVEALLRCTSKTKPSTQSEQPVVQKLKSMEEIVIPLRNSRSKNHVHPSKPDLDSADEMVGQNILQQKKESAKCLSRRTNETRRCARNELDRQVQKGNTEARGCDVEGLTACITNTSDSPAKAVHIAARSAKLAEHHVVMIQCVAGKDGHQKPERKKEFAGENSQNRGARKDSQSGKHLGCTFIGDGNCAETQCDGQAPTTNKATAKKEEALTTIVSELHPSVQGDSRVARIGKPVEEIFVLMKCPRGSNRHGESNSGLDLTSILPEKHSMHNEGTSKDFCLSKACTGEEMLHAMGIINPGENAGYSPSASYEKRPQKAFNLSPQRMLDAKTGGSKNLADARIDEDVSRNLLAAELQGFSPSGQGCTGSELLYAMGVVETYPKS